MKLSEEDILNKLENMCNEMGLPVEDAHAIWTDVQEIGLQNVINKVKSDGKKLKNAWEEITGLTFAIKTADDWYPEHWHDADILVLRKHIKGLQEGYEAALKETGPKAPDHQQNFASDLHHCNLIWHAIEQKNEADALKEYIIEKIQYLKLLDFIREHDQREAARREVKAG